MKEGRYVKATKEQFSQVKWERILSKDLQKPHCLSRFYSQLYSLFSDPTSVFDEGFSYLIKDQQTGVYFGAELTGFGPGYFGNPQIERLPEVVAAFDQYLETVSIENCRIEIQNDFGVLVLGAKNGVLFEEEILEEE